MTKKDFFRILIKLFGIYALILSLFTYIPSNISYITYQFEPINLIYVFGFTALIIGVYILLIRQTDRIINLLKIDKGFDDERIILGELNAVKILQLGLIIIGGFLIIDYLPNFLNYTFLAFKGQVSPSGLNYMEQVQFGSPTDYLNWFVSGFNLILGYLLLTNYLRIAKWLNRKDKNVGQQRLTSK
ncbi:hypothetical protein [Salinimicrobium gaetbulicola]|uniref:Uncharacterized protein n=1 Tax=Salinimicrobium gaetbulicola TaxID=999702 RepID=A0ABW3IG09_9FLAO